ncbi:hypothetical protein GF367_02180 [Candidatus Woesearchaeota archaeon]|nr:hypothetical protein [Candidatus Woesearchaeota archaeon]
MKEEKLSQGLITALFIFIIGSVGLELLKSILLHAKASLLVIGGVSLMSSLVGFVGAVLAIVAAFLARSLLMRLYNDTCNGLGTFLFNIFFLQIRINTLNKRKGIAWKFTGTDWKLLGIFVVVFVVYLVVVLTAPVPVIPDYII